MSTVLALLAGAVALVLLVAPIVLMRRHERAWQRPPWWSRPVDGPALRASLRPIDAPSGAEVATVRDVREVRGGRRRGPENGSGTAATGPQEGRAS